eukprot:jgi/Picre1/27431/NNA_000398.t1
MGILNHSHSHIYCTSALKSVPQGCRHVHGTGRLGGRVYASSDVASSPSDGNHSEFSEQLKGKLILAPLTRGNNLPFRRLVSEDFSAPITMSEMVFARYLIKGKTRENALIRRSDAEKVYGVQIATKTIDEGVKSGILAAEQGASFLI